MLLGGKKQQTCVEQKLVEARCDQVYRRRSLSFPAPRGRPNRKQEMSGGCDGRRKRLWIGGVCSEAVYNPLRCRSCWKGNHFFLLRNISPVWTFAASFAHSEPATSSFHTHKLIFSPLYPFYFNLHHEMFEFDLVILCQTPDNFVFFNVFSFVKWAINRPLSCLMHLMSCENFEYSK